MLHDLASANGTYVNGKRIRVAPLTHGARLRMGNTYGRFSEELPTESENSSIAAAEPFDQPAPSPPTEDLSNLDIMSTSSIERVNVETLPHDKLVPADLKKK